MLFSSVFVCKHWCRRQVCALWRGVKIRFLCVLSHAWGFIDCLMCGLRWFRLGRVIWVGCLKACVTVRVWLNLACLSEIVTTTIYLWLCNMLHYCTFIIMSVWNFDGFLPIVFPNSFWWMPRLSGKVPCLRSTFSQELCILWGFRMSLERKSFKMSEVKEQ